MSDLTLSDDLIREVFLKNGFTIKDGQTDLKDYVYAAARELIERASVAVPVAESAAPLKWIPEVKRIEDMSSRGYLKVMRDSDGDVIVAVHGMYNETVQPCEAVEFCVGRGGNRSPNTVKALLKLAEAMEKDNLENPIAAMKGVTLWE